MRRLALGIALLLAEGGCYHAMVRGGVRSPMKPQSRTAWNLFWGIGDANFDVSDCPQGIAQAEVWSPWWGVFPSLFTLGILSPQRLEYVCAAPPPAPVFVTPPASPAPPPPAGAPIYDSPYDGGRAGAAPPSDEPPAAPPPPRKRRR